MNLKKAQTIHVSSVKSNIVMEHLLSNSKLIADKKIDFKEFGTGRLLFLGGYTLSFMEYVLIGQQRLKYRFNLSDSKGKLIFRYDNAPHHKEIPTPPP